MGYGKAKPLRVTQLVESKAKGRWAHLPFALSYGYGYCMRRPTPSMCSTPVTRSPPAKSRPGENGFTPFYRRRDTAVTARVSTVLCRSTPYRLALGVATAGST